LRRSSSLPSSKVVEIEVGISWNKNYKNVGRRLGLVIEYINIQNYN
jgi:hypothetical protein